MKLRKMKEYLNSVKEIKKTLVALQLVAASEVKEIKKAVEFMFEGFHVITPSIKKVLSCYTNPKQVMVIPLTIDAPQWVYITT